MNKLVKEGLKRRKKVFFLLMCSTFNYTPKRHEMGGKYVSFQAEGNLPFSYIHMPFPLLRTGIVI